MRICAILFSSLGCLSLKPFARPLQIAALQRAAKTAADELKAEWGAAAQQAEVELAELRAAVAAAKERERRLAVARAEETIQVRRCGGKNCCISYSATASHVSPPPPPWQAAEREMLLDEEMETLRAAVAAHASATVPRGRAAAPSVGASHGSPRAAARAGGASSPPRGGCHAPSSPAAVPPCPDAGPSEQSASQLEQQLAAAAAAAERERARHREQLRLLRGAYRERQAEALRAEAARAAKEAAAGLERERAEAAQKLFQRVREEREKLGAQLAAATADVRAEAKRAILAVKARMEEPVWLAAPRLGGGLPGGTAAQSVGSAFQRRDNVFFQADGTLHLGSEYSPAPSLPRGTSADPTGVDRILIHHLPPIVATPPPGAGRSAARPRMRAPQQAGAAGSDGVLPGLGGIQSFLPAGFGRHSEPLAPLRRSEGAAAGTGALPRAAGSPPLPSTGGTSVGGERIV